TNQTQSTPLILSSSNISVLTVSTVIVGPPDFSTTRSPGLITAIEKIQAQLFLTGASRDKNRCILKLLHAPRGQSANRHGAQMPGEIDAPSSCQYFDLDYHTALIRHEHCFQ